MSINRDSLFWWFSIIGAVCVALPAHFGEFTFISHSWQSAIELIAFVYGIVSAKMATSPLKGKEE